MCIGVPVQYLQSEGGHSKAGARMYECMESDGGFTYAGCRTRRGMDKLGAGTEAAPMAAMGRPHPGKTARENVALAKQEQEASQV